MNEKTQFTEKQAVQLPFVELLINMGWEYLPHDKFDTSKKERFHYTLSNITFEALSNLNSYTHLGKEYKFSQKSINSAIEKIEKIQFDGIIPTSQVIYNMLMTGSTEKEELGDFDVKYFDFNNIKNNKFHVAVEYMAKGKEHNARLDIILFINGIPVAVVENKSETEKLDKAIKELDYYQQDNISAQFFAFPMMLIASNGLSYKYGTTKTPKKFYSHWKNKDFKKDEFLELVNKPINKSIHQELIENLGLPKQEQLFDRVMLEQDVSIISMLKPNTFMKFIRNFIIFESEENKLIKKAARYQQFYAVEAINERIRLFKDNNTKRRGGIVWHTQGSGKSLTMVMFAKSLISCDDIVNPRLIVVTDRKNLDEQIKSTFENCNIKNDVVKAESKKDLLKLLSSKKSDVITTLIHKFEDSDVKLEDNNIFVLIDEAHSSQSGEMHELMRKTLPNASYIGFTGTPLMKENKTTLLQFDEGEYSYIHKYTIDQALEDKAILDILYDPRFTEQTVINKDKLDKQIEKFYEEEDLSEVNKVKLQRKINSKKWASEQAKRVKKIALDVEEHFISNLKGTGLKGQLVAPSKRCAVLFHEALKDKINCAVIMSEESAKELEGNKEKADIAEFIKNHSVNGSFTKYEDEAISSFKKDENGVELLIVVSKLITGFDAPRNTVLYLTKELKEHVLLQAIARVNRLYNESKTAGFVLDYSVNAKNITDALKLFSSFEEGDIKGALFNPKIKFDELKNAHLDLVELFRGKIPLKDIDKHQAYYEVLEPENIRVDFYAKTNKFIKLLKDSRCLSKYMDIPEKTREIYAKDSKKFYKIKQAIQNIYADTFDAMDYKVAIMKILEENTTAEDVKQMSKPVDITSAEFSKQVESQFGKDDMKSVAKTIAHQTKAYIAQHYNKDKAFYERYSKLIDELFDKLKNAKVEDLFSLVEEANKYKSEVVSKKEDDIPSALREVSGSGIIYRNIRSLNIEPLNNISDEEYQSFILDITSYVKSKTTVGYHKNDEKLKEIRLYQYLIKNYEELLEDNDNYMLLIDRQVKDIAKNNPEEFYP